MIRHNAQADVDNGQFDHMTLIEFFSATWETSVGVLQTVQVRERGYLPAEVTARLAANGFVVDHIWGGTPGRLARRPLDLDEVMLLAVARKTAAARRR